MTSHIRRYVFLDFNTLKLIKFKKLEKVCDKVFVFVNSYQDSIPFNLVKEVQKMGNNLKWVEVSSTVQGDINYHICFLMGKLHEKISGDVEFAILSNDITFDPLVSFINSTGRSCLRIKQQQAGAEMPSPDSNEQQDPPIDLRADDEIRLEIKREPVFTTPSKPVGERKSETQAISEPLSEGALIDETAKETVKRLIRSGNRPAELDLLKNYILLHNQELSAHGHVDKIITKLESTNEIHLKNGEVIYNF